MEFWQLILSFFLYALNTNLSHLVIISENVNRFQSFSWNWKTENGAGLLAQHCYSEISDFSSRRAEFGRLAVLGCAENLPEPLDGVTV